VRLSVAKIVSVAICAGSANLHRSDREYLFFVIRRSLCMGNGEGDVAGLSICELEPANGFLVRYPHSDCRMLELKNKYHRSTSP